MPEVFYQQLHNAPLGPSAARRLGARNLVGRSTVSPLPRGASYASRGATRWYSSSIPSERRCSAAGRSITAGRDGPQVKLVQEKHPRELEVFTTPALVNDMASAPLLEKSTERFALSTLTSFAEHWSARR